MKIDKPKIVVIVGPTATGKSDLAVRLAKKFNGEVISADSRQVYRGLDLGSGKVPRDRRNPSGRVPRDHSPKYELRTSNYYHQGVRHHLLDVASPRTIFTVQKYQRLAQRAIKDILKCGKLPIICGGTGLYIDSVIYNTKFPEVAPNPKLRKQLESKTTEKLFEILKKLDEKRAQTIDSHNRVRLIRAIEIAKALGKVPELKTESPYEVLKIGLNFPKDELGKRIKKRLEKRLKQGMIKEVENLHNPSASRRTGGGLNWKRLDSFGLEYRFISRYLRGLLTYDQMKAEIIKESFRYAKRQMTWFKRDKNIVWENASTGSTGIEKIVSKFLL